MVDQVVDEAAFALQMNQTVEISSGERFPFYMLYVSAQILAVAVRDPARHQRMMATAESLLYATENSGCMMEGIFGATAANAVVYLIGRNEEGLTLNRETIKHNLVQWSRFFDPTDRNSHQSVRMMNML